MRASISLAQLVTWWSPNATVIRTEWRGVPGSGSARQVLRVAVRLAVVPQVLDEREQQRAIERVRVAAVEDLRELGEVAAPRQQQRVVHARDVQRRAREVGVDRRQRAAEDRALAAAVVEEMRGVDHALPVDPEDGARAEAARVDQVAAEVEEVDQPLLQPIRDRGEARQVVQRAAAAFGMSSSAIPISSVAHAIRPKLPSA